MNQKIKYYVSPALKSCQGPWNKIGVFKRSFYDLSPKIFRTQTCNSQVSPTLRYAPPGVANSKVFVRRQHWLQVSIFAGIFEKPCIRHNCTLSDLSTGLTKPCCGSQVWKK